MSNFLSRALVITAIAAPLTLAFAKGPANNVGQRHPNMAAAQDLIGKAYDRLEAAQKANEYDLGGHAKRAKEALKLAADEIKLAAETANQK